MSFTSVELCTGAGGQALGLHQAGFQHLALVEWDADACETLRQNGRRLGWAEDIVHQADLRSWIPPESLRGSVDLLAAGVPCPPFSIAGKRLGDEDERDLFPALLDVIEALDPRAVQVENVRGLLTRKFEPYRTAIDERLRDLGYQPQWKLLNASDFGVSQLRPRAIMVALKSENPSHFEWPEPSGEPAPTVGEVLLPSMRVNGWKGALNWSKQANKIAPTIVGGSRKHGGADLGPTRAKQSWAALAVNGHGIADTPPAAGFTGNPKLTLLQAAMLQGFPASWEVYGRKTSAYRQIGNAFPPPVARAVGEAISAALVASGAVPSDIKVGSSVA